MSLTKLLTDPERPPSKRWSAVYLGSLLGGFFLTSYATEIAHRLAPGKPDIVVEAAPPADDYPTPQQVPPYGYTGTIAYPVERTIPVDLTEDESLDIETLAATDLD